MKNQELKLFVGGYYDDRIFEDVEEKTPFDKTVDVYSLKEVLELGFVENVEEEFNETKADDELEFNELSYDKKVNAILNYVESDEIADLCWFDTEEESLQYKENVLKEIEKLEDEYEYTSKIQDNYGYFREVYVKKTDVNKRPLVLIQNSTQNKHIIIKPEQ